MKIWSVTVTFKGSESLFVIMTRDGLIIPTSPKILLQYTSCGLKYPLSTRLLDYLESDMQIPSASMQKLLERGLGNISFVLFIKKNNHNRHWFTYLVNSLGHSYLLPRQEELACEHTAINTDRARLDRIQTSQCFPNWKTQLRTLLWIEECFH